MRIAICMWYDSHASSYGNIVKKINQLYCDKNGYDLIFSDTRKFPQRKQHWERVPLVLSVINNYDYVVWIDADAFFYTDAPKLEEIIQKHKKDLLFCEDTEESIDDSGSVASGLFIAKNTDKVKAILKEWCYSDYLYENRDKRWQDQSALRLMIKENILDVSNEIGLIPYGELQNYNGERKGNIPYVWHMAGINNETRTRIANDYLSKIKNMPQGVLIIACGHPIYGNMAFNLALTIKYNAPCHITVAYSEQSLSELSEEQLKYFDNIIEVPERYYLNNGKKAYQRIKVYANEITPYEETILIDADTIWNEGRDIKLLFNQDNIFNIGVMGKWENGKETFPQYTYWEKPTKIVEYWNTNKIYKTYSGFIYWKKESEFIWKEVQRVYDDQDAPCAEWAGDKPDEYGFNIGIPLSGYSLPHHEYMPVFFGFTGYKYTSHQIKKNFEGMSVAGNFPDPYLITAYHETLRTITRRIGVPHKEYIKKGNVIAERANL